MKLDAIVMEVDRRASNFEIGKLQSIRKQMKGLLRQASLVFGSANKPNWAFHYGGREELQFNLGIEDTVHGEQLRHGVAFSFQPSRSMPDITELLPRVARFNEYLRAHPEDFGAFEMWHYTNAGSRKGRSANYRPIPIEPILTKNDTFIFMGGLESVAAPNFDVILADFDRLLPLYEYVEGGQSASVRKIADEPILFKAGCSVKADWTSASYAARTLDVNLRHAAIQSALYRELIMEHGEGNVGAENICLSGGRVDMYVKKEKLRYIYEIKTAQTARSCIREALGQLLDYCCWHPRSIITEAFVVGEPKPTAEDLSYLQRLNDSFPVKLSYRSILLA